MVYEQPLLVIQDETPMYVTMYSIACAYAHSGSLVESFGIKREEIAFTFPAAVCQSFAIELFLKFFFVVDFPEIHSRNDLKKHNVIFKPSGSKGHGYSALWDMISPNYQDQIAQQARVNNQQFRQQLLDIGDDPFVKWRYIHEEDGIHLLPLGMIKGVADAFGYAAEGVMKERRKK